MRSRNFKLSFNFLANLLLVGLLASCLPSNTSGGRKTKSASTVATGNSTATDYSDTTDDDNIYWYSEGNYVEGTLTVDANIDTSIFIRGTAIHDYLKTSNYYSKTYCALFTFDSSNITNKEQLRVRAVPVSTTNISTGVQEYTWRIDLDDETTNTSACNGSITSRLNSALTIAAASAAYDADQICTSCTGRLNSSSVLIYTTTSNSMSDSSLISTSALNLTGMQLTIDMSNSTGGSSGNSTSDAQCVALGYDCSLSGQCVNDGALRPGATGLANYTQAQQDVAQNASHFVLYPEIYYVCGQAPAATPISTGAADVEATGAAMLTYAIAQYQCFYDSTTTTYCGIGSYSPTYNDTQEDIRVQCGCDADPDASYPDDPATACPGYGLSAVLSDGSTITGTVLTSNQSASVARIDCIVPDSGADPTPFQELQLAMNNRHGPHRMFLSNGTPVSDITDYYGSPVAAEGTPFSYLDDGGKTLPDNGSFNMNHIIGQFNVNLSEALPAIEVNVEYDQSYTISAIEGYSTPCLSCARDSWFSAFTAHPESQMGAGVSSISFTTVRDDWGDNLSYGNYEDTIFGRACWVPPTMIPWSHNPNASVQTQRLGRLSTQAAFWVNGYQRDWWGFNKNALIGSWDGVRWFAIGKGRRVKAKTKKLYLAMNSPYADLAEATDITVQVVADSSFNSAAKYDYDPGLSYNHPSQNSAGSCQMWHMCSTDTDCITKLGWEYTCADVSKFKSLWPDFDSDANEKANTSKAYTIASILEQGSITGGSNNRCVYRGAGAPCKLRYWEVNGTDATSNRDTKYWACAPNFHCEALSGTNYNREVIRERDSLSQILYGQEADVLGRPASYLGAGYSLSSTISTNIQANATAAGITSPSTTVGICRPGKDLTQGDQRLAHIKADTATLKRADYISQIAPCDPTPAVAATGVANPSGAGNLAVRKSLTRVASCPVLDQEGNYVYNTIEYMTPAPSDSSTGTVAESFLYYSRAQNSCSRESQNTSGVSAFSYIEAPPIATAIYSGIFEPSMAMNACLRRAGAVCHTDLDCTPNKLHAEQAAMFDTSYFGGTEEEKEFWEQYLVCGQAQEKPLSNDPNYFDYDMSKNRCCREVGKDISMFTQYALETTSTLDVDKLSSVDPNGTGRYSRYNTIFQAFPFPSPQPTVSANAFTQMNYPVVENGLNDDPSKSLYKQWKTIQETGRLTCCGGGFIRKFADGGHDWSKTNRVNYNVSDFQCLNYSNTIALARPSSIPSTAYTRSVDVLCSDPANGGCIQPSMDSTYNYPVAPEELSDSIDTVSNYLTSDDLFTGMDMFSPHSIKPVTADVDYIDFDWIDDVDNGGNGDGDITSLDTYSTMEFWIPSYIHGCDNLNNSYIPGAGIAGVYRYEEDGTIVSDGNPSPLDDDDIDYSDPDAIVANDNYSYSVGCWDDEVMGANCSTPTGESHVVFCWDFNSTGKLYVKYNNTNFTAGRKIYWSVNFQPAGTDSWYYTNADPGSQLSSISSVGSGPSEGTTPANPAYYLMKFGKFELKGIPQITYEPLYCNSDANQLVPNLFDISDTDSDGKTRDQFEALGIQAPVDGDGDDLPFTSIALQGDPTNSGGYLTYQDKVATDDVFSESEFMCCVNLGEETDDATQCCSYYGVDTDGDGKFTCKLPAYADLSVYFNAFVSADGRGENAPGGGLTDDDFHPLTGEPNIIKFNDTDATPDGDYDSVTDTSDTWEKLIALGEAYCESGKVTSGGAFGDFQGEPFPSAGQTESYIYSIIDSPLDYSASTGAEEERGYVKFMSGARWNHHVYCAP